jgi:hypothetical protein
MKRVGFVEMASFGKRDSAGASHWADENPWFFRIAFVLVLMRRFTSALLPPLPPGGLG